MSAIKRYIEEQATLIANEYGGNVDDIICEITSYIVDRGFSTVDAIQAVSANIAAEPLQLAVYKACGIDPLALIDIDDCCFTDEEKDIIREKLKQKFKEDNPHLFQD